MKTAILTFALACALAFALAAPAWAAESVSSFHSGNELLTMCEDDASAINVVGCINYIAGVSDGIKAAFNAPGRGTPYCTSAGVTKGQLERVVLKYLRAHPERGHWAAAGLVAEALQNAFPCN